MNNNLKTKTMNNQIEVEINGNKVTLTLTDDQISQLQKATQKEWWEEIKYPKNDAVNASYGYLTPYHRPFGRYWPEKHAVDDIGLERRMTFNNEKQAQLAADYMNLFTEMYNFAQLRNGMGKIDWRNNIDLKYAIEFNGSRLTLYITKWNFIVNGIFGIAFIKKEHAEEAIDIFGERIIALFSKLQNY